ncbi:MAG: T9SS type A sorting domain-containing protein [Bacteroidales bacterium]|nr:T9SS type A sorting domain-containing protein [Bacteroidales bacterium]
MKKNIFLGLIVLLLTSSIYAEDWLWSRHISCGGEVSVDKIANDNNNNIYVIGYFSGGNLEIGNDILTCEGDNDIFISKFDSKNNYLWTKSFGGKGKEETTSISIDNQNNIIVSGFFQSDTIIFETDTLLNDGNNDAFILKMNYNGDINFVKRVFWGEGLQKVLDVTLDYNNLDLVAVGMFKEDISFFLDSDTVYLEAQGPKNLFITRFDNLGNVVNFKRFIATERLNTFKHIQLDKNDGYYITGNLVDTLFLDTINYIVGYENFWDILVINVNEYFNVQWARKGGGVGYDNVTESVVDNYGNIYIAGTVESNVVFDSTASQESRIISGFGSFDYYIGKYNKGGNLDWVIRNGGVGFDGIYGIQIVNDKLLVGGKYTGEVEINNIVLSGESIIDQNGFYALYDTLGNAISAKHITGDSTETITCVSVDGLNQIYLGGYSLSNNLYVGNDTLNNLSAPLADVFVTKIGWHSLKIAETQAQRCDTLLIPINIGLGINTINSVEFKLSGYISYIEFLGIETENTLSGKNNWTFSVNITDTNLIIASAGANEISEDGIFVYLKFFLPFNTLGYVPINIDTVLIDEYEFEILSESGGISISESNALYGDASLNGEVRAYDAALTLKYIVGAIDFNCRQLENADVEEDNIISALDASYILQYVSGKLPILPYENFNKPGTIPPTVEVKNVKVLSGKEISIPITIKGAKGTIGFYQEFEYSPEILSFLGIEYSDEISKFLNASNTVNNRIKLAAASDSSISQDNAQVNLKFKVADNFEEGETKLTIIESKFNGQKTPNVSESTSLIEVYPSAKIISDNLDLYLEQNYPNPFQGETNISFSIPESGNVSLKIYNLTGQQIEVLVDNSLKKGWHTFTWTISDHKINSGIYYCELVYNGQKQVKKVVVQ